MLLLSMHPLPCHLLQLQEMSSGTLIRREAELVPCQETLVIPLLVAANRFILRGGWGLLCSLISFNPAYFPVDLQAQQIPRAYLAHQKTSPSTIVILQE